MVRTVIQPLNPYEGLSRGEEISAALRAETERIMTGWGGRVVRRMATYPAQLPGSHYRRTGTLGRNWRMQLARGGAGDLQAAVTNPVSYSGPVEGAAEPGSGMEMQAAEMQRRNWPQLDRASRQEWTLAFQQLQEAFRAANP